MMSSRVNPFSFSSSAKSRLAAAVGPPLEGLLGLRSLGRVYDDLPRAAPPREFLERTLERLDVRLEVSEADLQRIPASGPAVVVANHPFGGIEGLALALLLMRVRPDVRLMANRLLGRIPELAQMFVLVDPFERSDSPRKSLVGLRAASRWLAEGGVLALFPAGEVAHLHLRQRAIVDPPWSPTVARLIRRAQCPTIPVWFPGRNRKRFQLIGMVHPALRTAMLPRELLARQGRALEARVGSPIPFARIKGLASDAELVDLLRRRTEILAERPATGGRTTQPRRTPPKPAPIIEPVPPEDLAVEIAGLPPDAMLAANGPQQVWIAEADQIPAVLREIGRLREVTFRAVGEGTGNELDLDRFDETYLHLFIWQAESRQVIGAYRLGRSDQLLAAEGIAGLYTSTLFRFSPKLFDAMGPALEMGRSFIRPESQRSFTGLLLLWKGIGRYVLAHPEYATLFGPVSISADYHTSSQQLIAAFLKHNLGRHPLARFVRPRTPLRGRPSRVLRRRLDDLADLDEVSQYIGEIEADGKGIPILLKQYLKLGGALLGFNVDPDFANVLDVLILVDLRGTEPRTLARYMGADEATRFLAHHSTK